MYVLVCVCMSKVYAHCDCCKAMHISAYVCMHEQGIYTSFCFPRHVCTFKA
jgi:hypothetical protein